MADVSLRLVGGLVFAAGIAVGVFVVASWLGLSALAALVPALIVFGMALVIAGTDTDSAEDSESPPTAEDLRRDQGPK